MYKKRIIVSVLDYLRYYNWIIRFNVKRPHYFQLPFSRSTMRTFPNGALSAEKLQSFFITHLNRIYCAKSHLQERLPEIQVEAHFGDLTNAIAETLDDVEKQIGRMDQIFLLLRSKPDFKNCEGMIGLIEDTFTAISGERHDPELCDLAILFYLHQIESIETASFGMIKLAVPSLEKKEIKHLLQVNFDEATEDLALFRFIAANYFKNNWPR